MNKTLILGAGLTGLSMARYLLWLRAGRRGNVITVVDNRTKPPMATAIESLIGHKNCRFGEDYQRWQMRTFASFDYICLSPGLPFAWVSRIKKHYPKKILGELSIVNHFGGIAHQAAPLLVTGTNGKSTVCALVMALCRAAGLTAEVVGNFGYPLLDAWGRWSDSTVCRGYLFNDSAGENCGLYDSAHQLYPPKIAVTELSSFQLQYAPPAPTLRGFSAHAAVVLNISPDHLDYHSSMEEYADIKSRIYNLADYAVINLDDARATSMATSHPRRVTFSRRRAAHWSVGGRYIIGGDRRFAIREISSALSVENALAALALFSTLYKRRGRFGYKATIIYSGEALTKRLRAALKYFPGLPHRRQRLCLDKTSFEFINDSKATNVESTCFALGQIRGDIILIAGGDSKGQNFMPLVQKCQAVKQAFLIGKDAPLLQSALQSGNVKCQRMTTMKAAVKAAVKVACPGDKILLSPACSSLDAYENYAARGDDFIGEAKLYAT